jgi:hypothetical protein
LKYVVWKVEDVLAVCNQKQVAMLDGIGKMIGEKRLSEGKTPDNFYYIVNADEPYADKVKALIEEHEGEKVIFD